MENKTKKTPKFDWICHYVSNGVACDMCNKTEDSFPEFICNAHTHGMEKYNHLDFQIVLDVDAELIGTLLNEMGLRVQMGGKFKSGDVLSDLLVGYDAKLFEVPEKDRTVLRIILPDENNLFPGDEGCQYPYNQQMIEV